MHAMAHNRIRFRQVGTTVVTWCLLAAVTVCSVNAATKEEVDRCRAIEQRAERLDCFKALKHYKPAKTESAVPANPQSIPSTKKEDAPSAKAGDMATPNATPNATLNPTLNAAPAPRPDPSATTAAINRLNVGSGRPLCADRDALAGMLIAGLLTADPARAATPGCQTLPADAKLQIVERYPGVFSFMRMVGVKVMSPTRPDLTVGFTIEIDSLATEGSALKAPQ
jgi:hypothetical protein